MCHKSVPVVIKISFLFLFTFLPSLVCSLLWWWPWRPPCSLPRLFARWRAARCGGSVLWSPESRLGCKEEAASVGRSKRSALNLRRSCGILVPTWYSGTVILFSKRAGSVPCDVGAVVANRRTDSGCSRWVANPAIDRGSWPTAAFCERSGELLPAVQVELPELEAFVLCVFCSGPLARVYSRCFEEGIPYTNAYAFRLVGN